MEAGHRVDRRLYPISSSFSFSILYGEMFSVFCAISGRKNGYSFGKNINFDEKGEAQYCRGFFKVSDYN